LSGSPNTCKSEKEDGDLLAKGSSRSKSRKDGDVEAKGSGSKSKDGEGSVMSEKDGGVEAPSVPHRRHSYS